MIQKLNDFVNTNMGLKIVSSFGQARDKNTENEIGIYVPVWVKIIEFLTVFLSISIVLTVALVLLKSIIEPNLFGNMFLTSISTSLIYIGIYGHNLFNKEPSKLKIVKYQKYIYLESSFGTLISIPVKDIKSTLENSKVIIKFEEEIEVWFDLDSIDDKSFQAEFLKYLGLTDANYK